MPLQESLTHWGESLLNSPRTIILYLLSALFLINTVQRIRRWYRLRHIPGPWICGFTSLWLLRKCFGPRIDLSWKELVEKYGPVVRMAPNEIILADVDELLRIQSPRSVYRKDDWYLIGQINPPFHNLLSMQDKDVRRERKRKVTPGYNGRGGDDFEQGLNKGIARWIELIERKYLSTPAEGKPLDLALHSHYYALDSLGEMAYSRQLGFLESDTDKHRILETNEKLMPVMFLFSNFIWLTKYLRYWPLVLLLPRDGDKSGFGAIMGFVLSTLDRGRHDELTTVHGRFSSSIIDQRLAELAQKTKPKGDILQAFINENLHPDALREEVTIQFFVGSDTTASLIRMTFLALLTNPRVYMALQSEINNATKLSSPITATESRQLPYLQAVIRESLRFYPPVAAGVFYKDVPAEGDVLCGKYFLPGGTKVSTIAGLTALLRDKRVFGEDAECFWPERWIEAEKSRDGGEKLRQMSKSLDLCFGAGQFACSGKGIALMSAGKVIPELLRRYDFSILNPAEPMKLRGAVAWLAHDFWVRVEKRPVRSTTVGIFESYMYGY
ncbi:Cytochrome P450 [Rhypophila decipiens]